MKMLFKDEQYHEIDGRLYRKLKSDAGRIVVEQLDAEGKKYAMSDVDDVTKINSENLTYDFGPKEQQTIIPARSRKR